MFTVDVHVVSDITMKNAGNAPVVARLFAVALALLPPQPHAAGQQGATRSGPASQASSQVARLGCMLFFEPALSADGRTACASCHRPELAFTDGLPRAAGVHARQGTRNTPSLLDVRQQRSLFWDGRRGTLEDQALDPLLHPMEQGLRDPAHLLDILRREDRYVHAFKAAFGVAAGAITAGHVAQALAAFQRTLVSGATPFDRFLAGQPHALSPAARRGWMVFDLQAHCTRCHEAAEAGGAGAPALFTDHQFHSLAVGFAKVERKLPALAQRLMVAHREGRQFSPEILADADVAELGRFVHTMDPRDLGAFKTPGLRNVGLTAPYMHDGSVPSLAEAVDLEVYYRGARDGRPLILTPAERDDLVAFLHALTSDPVPSMEAPVAAGGSGCGNRSSRGASLLTGRP